MAANLLQQSSKRRRSKKGSFTVDRETIVFLILFFVAFIVIFTLISKLYLNKFVRNKALEDSQFAVQSLAADLTRMMKEEKKIHARELPFIIKNGAYFVAFDTKDDFVYLTEVDDDTLREVYKPDECGIFACLCLYTDVPEDGLKKNNAYVKQCSRVFSDMPVIFSSRRQEIPSDPILPGALVGSQRLDNHPFHYSSIYGKGFWNTT